MRGYEKIRETKVSFLNYNPSPEGMTTRVFSICFSDVVLNATSAR